ncbi:hypothetical protein ACFLEY_07205 [Bradyrhizobium sp. YCK136]|uniref:hypothetical protein n=1 Tax=Bradyrhizobium sp. YCK136 TaxID=3351346 RepID=UPI0037CB5D25
MKDRDYYLSLRRRYEPEQLKLVIVAESPPASGLYFYDPVGKVSEPLFAAFMQQIAFAPSNKEEGLVQLRQRGWLLVDATYEQVDKREGRDETILRDFPLLCDDLVRLSPDKTVPLILIKVNVCRLLGPKLLTEGFKVANQGREIYFPSHGNQPKFHQQFSDALQSVV